MKIEDQFHLLIVDEVRAQPAMLKQLTKAAPTRNSASALAKLSPLLGPAGHPEFLVQSAGLAPKIAAALGLKPIGLQQILERWQRDSEQSVAAHYEALCRGALTALLWRDLPAAEAMIQRAKFEQDEWAMAHYVYGLLFGLSGKAGKAHFELYLALHREPYPEARVRTERALSLVA